MKGTSVIYIDPFGGEHDAIVTAENGLHPGFLSLVYVDVKAPEADNVRKLFDIPHMDARVNTETNPDLPDYHVNVWKDYDEDHDAPPSDQAQHEHPFKFQADKLREHQEEPRPTDGEDEMKARAAASAAAAGNDSSPASEAPALPSAADLDTVADEQKAAEATAKPSALDKLKALAANYHGKEPDVTAQLEADAKASDSDATGTK